MTSWGGTSMVTVLRSTLTILSTIGRRMNSPGPFGPPWTRPSLKMTPRSYSFTILMALSISETTKIATIISAIAANPIPTACSNAKVIRSCSSSVSADLGNGAAPARPGSPRLYHRRIRKPGTKKGRPAWDLPNGFSPFVRPLEQPPRAGVAVYPLHAGYRDVARVVRGVDDGAVAHGYADVGDTTATLGEEHQVAGSRGTADRGTVAHLRARIIRQRDAELLVDQHREAGAVLRFVGYARSEPVGRAQVGPRLGDHRARRTARLAARLGGTAPGRSRRGGRCDRRRRGAPLRLRLVGGAPLCTLLRRRLIGGAPLCTLLRRRLISGAPLCTHGGPLLRGAPGSGPLVGGLL